MMSSPNINKPIQFFTAKWLIAFSSISAVLFACFAIFAPTEIAHSNIVGLAERRLASDLSISGDKLEFSAGRFRRESIVVYRVVGDSLPTDKFLRPVSEQQRDDLARQIAEVAQACGMQIVPSSSDDLLVFYGTDYTVLYLGSTPSSYLIYLGGQ